MKWLHVKIFFRYSNNHLFDLTLKAQVLSLYQVQNIRARQSGHRRWFLTLFVYLHPTFWPRVYLAGLLFEFLQLLIFGGSLVTGGGTELFTVAPLHLLANTDQIIQLLTIPVFKRHKDIKQQ